MSQNANESITFFWMTAGLLELRRPPVSRGGAGDSLKPARPSSTAAPRCWRFETENGKSTCNSSHRPLEVAVSPKHRTCSAHALHKAALFGGGRRAVEYKSLVTASMIKNNHNLPKFVHSSLFYIKFPLNQTLMYKLKLSLNMHCRILR